MESDGVDTGPPQEASYDVSTTGAAPKKDSKGKEREITFGGRLQASGRMALNAAIAAKPSLAGPSNGKPSAGRTSPTQDEGPISKTSLSEASHSHGTPALGGSLRKDPHTFSQSSFQYDEFLNATPQMQDAFQPTIQSGESVHNSSFREQTTADGADVVKLLSMPEEEPKHAEFDELLSEQEAARLREAFFANSASRPALDRLLGFSPGFVLDANLSCEAKSHTGIEDTGVARDIWLQQWHDVLSSYTDEVWGDLRFLVEGAKREIETARSQEGTRSPESKALERLRQILAHIRGHI
ncbi:hypothetical protein MY11210_009574 [Beauveria gryllotalpidicola]